MACVDIPALPLQLLLRRHPDWRKYPAAVVDRDKAQGILLWVNEHARRTRILPGMRYAAGLSLSRELRAGVVDEGEIARAVDELTGVLRFFTSDVEPSAEPGVFWLDASGLSLLYPSLLRWAELIREDLRERKLHSAVAVGFSRFGTYALARSGRQLILLRDPDEEQERARSIPLERLGFPPKTRDALHKLGVDVLGDFLALPSAGVLRRFGSEVHALYKLAAGELWAPLQPLAAVDPVTARRRLDHGEGNLDRLVHLIEEMLRPLLAMLEERCQLLGAVELDLCFEDGPPRSERLRPAQPTLEARIILELLRLRLESVSLKEGAIEVGLELEGVAATREQKELFLRNPQRDPAAVQRAFARLRAEFGDDAVVRAHLNEGHLPEARFSWEPMSELGEAQPRTVRRRPLIRRVLPRAHPLARQDRKEPDGWMIVGLEGGAVEEVLGPYVVSGGWWLREVHREYHFVRTAKMGWLWVYFDRQRRRWFLHGAVE